jgi:hypothetical protein
MASDSHLVYRHLEGAQFIAVASFRWPEFSHVDFGVLVGLETSAQAVGG